MANDTSYMGIDEWDRFQGEKFDRDLRGAALTAAIRADLKAAVASGDLAKLSYGVRLEKGSMYQGVIITVRGFERPLERAHFEWNGNYASIRHDETGRSLPRYKDELARVIAKVEAIAKAYQRYESHVMSDYDNRNFHLQVTVDECGDRIALEADLRARGATPAPLPSNVAVLDAFRAERRASGPNACAETGDELEGWRLTRAALVPAADVDLDDVEAARRAFSMRMGGG